MSEIRKTRSPRERMISDASQAAFFAALEAGAAVEQAREIRRATARELKVRWPPVNGGPQRARGRA